MEPRLNEQYMSGQFAIDALSVVFNQSGLQSLTVQDDTNEDNNIDMILSGRLPIGFELLQERATPHLMKSEYNERNEATMKVVEQWETALLQWTTKCGRVHKQFQSKSPSVDHSKQVSNGRKAEDVTTTVSTLPSHKKCCVDGCDGNEVNSKLKRVAEYPPDLPSDASVKRQITNAIKQFKQEERTERLGFGRQCAYTELRACKKHWVSVKGKSVNCTICSEDGTTVTECVPIPPFLVPEYVGDKSFAAPPKSLSRGNAIDRATIRHVTDVSKNAYALGQQQIIEMQDVKDRRQTLDHINSTVLAAAGLDVHIDTTIGNELERNTAQDMIDNNMDDSWRAPTIMLKHLVPKEVKRRTGFHDLKLLLSFASVICGGDLSIMTQTSSILTWLEEWILYFELAWGRTIVRFSDYSTIYNCREQTLREVIRQKVGLILTTRDRWPMYASYAEDAKLRDPSWSGHFDPVNGHRVIMHDSTNIPLAQPTSAALQRALYNSYYGMCCAKGGVAVQLCGYIYGLPLNTGHSDDTRFIEDTKILEKQ